MEFAGPEEVRVTRPAFTVAQRNITCHQRAPEDKGTFKAMSAHARKGCRCDLQCIWATAKRRVPILDWLPRYDIRSYLVRDIISGVTVAVMHISQGMAYALLAGLPPVVGLYTAFFPVLPYILFGTSPHASMGSAAITCIMMSQVTGELATDVDASEIDNGTVLNSTSETLPQYSPTEVAAALSFMVGSWEILLGVLQLGEIFGQFLSEILVSGFTTAVAIQVLISQIKSFIGVAIPRHGGPFNILYTCYDIAGQIFYVNPTVILMSVVVLVVLVVNNELIKPRMKKVTNVPIPIELAAIAVGSALSYLLNLSKEYNVPIVGEVPTGLPTPSMPRVDLLPRLVVSGFVIGLVGYTSSFSIAKIFAKKHRYEVDATQELYAQGLCCIFASFFSCGPMTAALSRSLIQEAVGAATMLTATVSCLCLLLIIVFVGPLFETLPNCVLAAIIVVSLKGMLLQFQKVPTLWRASRLDSLVWLTTFVTSVIVSIDYGLLAGIVTSLLVLVGRSRTASVRRLGRVRGTEIFLPCELYEKAEEVPGVRVLGVYGPLHFANTAYLRERLEPGAPLVDPTSFGKTNVYSITGNSVSVDSSLGDFSFSSDVRGLSKGDTAKVDANHPYQPNSTDATEVLPLVLDLSNVGFVDTCGGKTLRELHDELRGIGVLLCLATPSERVLSQLEACGTLEVIPKEQVFHSVHDAVTILTKASTHPPTPALSPETETSVTGL